MWNQILAANGPRVARILRNVAADTTALADALDDMAQPGARKTVAEHMRAGNEGVSKVPGKHGSRRTFARLTVLVDDQPGQLARLFADIGAAEINIEELVIEHSPGVNLGLVQLEVLPEAHGKLIEVLEARGWRLAQ
jgi:prephenate dehydrogenase